MNRACLWCPGSNKQRFVYLPVDILSLKIRWQLLSVALLLCVFFWGGPQRLQVWRPAVGCQHKKPIEDLGLTYTSPCAQDILLIFVGPLQRRHPSQSHRKHSPGQTWDTSERRSEKCCLWKAGSSLFLRAEVDNLLCSKMATSAKRRIQPLNHISYKACKRRSIYYTCKFTHYKAAFPTDFFQVPNVTVCLHLNIAPVQASHRICKTFDRLQTLDKYSGSI